MERKTASLFLCSLLFLLASCTFNPFSSNNHLTGSPEGAFIGGAIGAGTTALLGFPKPIVGLAGIGGAGLGYYVTTLRYAAGGVVQSGGQVFVIGNYVTISIPSDQLFDSNSAEFLYQARFILNSVVQILNRYPDLNILVSGNTSGFYPCFEKKLSENRARQVASYLWAHGISNFKPQSIQTRRLDYIGYGDIFPIANHIRAVSLRQNSRIQITAYPSNDQLIDICHRPFYNIGGIDNCKKQSFSSESYLSNDSLPVTTDNVPPSFKENIGVG